MIPITPKSEPVNFGSSVRIPGLAFLRRVPSPTPKQFKNNSYWKGLLPEMKAQYGGICAYSALWIAGGASIDHFLPKSTHPLLAYEWSNYRLAMSKINSNKGDSIDILDPFTIQPGWFTLDVASLWIRPEPLLSHDVLSAVERTINRLKLNDDEWVTIRFEIYKDYLNGDIQLSFLQNKYPFIAAEIMRQGILPKAIK